jgi:hypothetical protein
MIWPFGRRRRGAQARIAALEAFAEKAYDAMYDARRPQDAWNDAREALAEAIQLARSAGLKAEARRLHARLDHIHAVYTHQFR